MATKSEQVLIRITPDTKDEWQSALDESRFTSLAEFIRFAVNNEIHGRHDGAEVDTEALEDGLNETSESLRNHHDSITERLESIEAAITGVQDELGGSVSVAESEIIQAIPSLHKEAYWENTENPQTPVDKPEGWGKEMWEDSVSAEKIAEKLDYPTQPVRRTLQNLTMKSDRVFSLTYDNETRFHINV